MKKTVLIYGGVGAILVLGLKLIEYRFLVVEYSLEIYGGLIALLFSVVGIVLGLKLTKTKETIRETVVETVVVREVPVPIHTIGPFTPNVDRISQLGITPRELQIVQLMAEGLSNKEIADRLFVSENTVKTHSSRVFEKLQAKRRTQAVQFAKDAGIIA